MNGVLIIKSLQHVIVIIIKYAKVLCTTQIVILERGSSLLLLKTLLPLDLLVKL